MNLYFNCCIVDQLLVVECQWIFEFVDVYWWVDFVFDYWVVGYGVI